MADFKLVRGIVLFLVAFLLTIPVVLEAQEKSSEQNLQQQAIKTYLDVSGWLQEYIKTEIPYVNYVRDRQQAQVYIMMTDQETGAGGDEYTIKLIGQKNFVSIDDTLKYVSLQADTDEIIRSGIVKVLKQGLMRYVEKTPLAKYIDIAYQGTAKPMEVVDKWNYWVFFVDMDVDLEAEQSQDEYAVDVTFSAERVTPRSKISLRLDSDYRRNNYDLEDGQYTSISRSRNLRGLYVKSINDHWSAGMYTNANTSTYANKELSINVAPAIEYNIFPYSDYTRREFRLLYRTFYNNVRYEEETIYDKTKENLFYQSLSATFELKERWGSLYSSMEGLHYFHDFSKNRLQFFCDLDVRLFEGFSLNMFGYVSMIRDQISLPKSGATEEEILLRRKQIATDYEYFISFGFRYTFGSIYSNVVNPRFGS